MDSKQPLVTVFTLVYNTKASYIIECIQSIFNSTYKNFEFILLDDCSPDKENFEVIKQWILANQIPCTILEHTKNMGICASINHVLSLSKGKYFFGCCDDLIEPEKIARQVQIMENAPADVAMVYSDAYLIDSKSQPLYGWFIQRYRQFFHLPSGNIYEALLQGNFIPAMSVLVKKSIFEEVGLYDENIGFEDYDMWLRIAKNHKIIYSDYVSAKYRIHGESLTHSDRDWTLDHFKITLKHVNHIGQKEVLLDMLLQAYRRNSPYAKIMADLYSQTVSNLPLTWFIKNKIPFNIYRFFKKITGKTI